MSNPLVLATHVLIQSGLTDRILFCGGEMADGMWVLGIRPKTGTVPLGGLTVIRWRLIDVKKWGDLFCSEILENEDSRYGANATVAEETAQLNALLADTRAALVRRAPLTSGEFEAAARLLAETQAVIRAETVAADRARVAAILTDAVENAHDENERAYYEGVLARHLASKQ